MSTKRNSTRSKITRTPQIEQVYAANPEDAAYTHYLNDLERWFSLENFRNSKAKAIDWQRLEYWLYFTEAMITQYEVGDTIDDKELIAIIIEDAWNAVQTTAQRFNASGFKIMRMSTEERDAVCEAFLLCDKLKATFTDNELLLVAMHVREILKG